MACLYTSRVNMKVNIKRDECIGCGACQSVNDDMFELDGDHKSTFIEDNKSKFTAEQVKEVAEVCPMDAIEVFDGDGVKIYPV